MRQRRLIFFFMNGCATCASVKPVVRAFRDGNPHVDVTPVDVVETRWPAKAWFPKVTPTLVEVDDNGRILARFDGEDDGEGGRIVTANAVRTWLKERFQ